jgi:hypothetical protein
MGHPVGSVLIAGAKAFNRKGREGIRKGREGIRKGREEKHNRN